MRIFRQVTMGTLAALLPLLVLVGCPSSYDDDDADGERPLDTSEEPETCDQFEEGPVTLFMSADDSNSQADPVLSRHLIAQGYPVDAPQRVYEFLNYYTFDFAPAGDGHVDIVPQMVQHPDDPDAYTLLVGVVSPHEALSERRPMNLTFSLDTSGSMGGSGIQLEKDVLRAVASTLVEGDVISIVTWDSTASVVADSMVVQGPEDPALLAKINQLSADGSTNLNQGLQRAYQLAQKNYSPDRLNRVFLVSDGGANTGVTDDELIAQNADDGEAEGIYLVGVGCGDSYHHGLMDTVTDMGKGAYIYIDSQAEAHKMFTGERFMANMEIAARDVELSITMPGSFLLEEFHGEQVSTDPAEVEDQHLAPNDAMLYHQILRDCAADEHDGSENFEFVVTWTDPRTREARVDIVEMTLAELLAAPKPQLAKADAVVAYAKALHDVWQLPPNEQQAHLQAVHAELEKAHDETGDPELLELIAQLEQFATLL